MELTKWILNMLQEARCACTKCSIVMGPAEVVAIGVRECGLRNSGASVIFADLRCSACRRSVRRDLCLSTLREFAAGVWCEELFARRVHPSAKVIPSVRPLCSPAPISANEARQLARSVHRVAFRRGAPTWQRFLSALGVPEEPLDDLPF